MRLAKPWPINSWSTWTFCFVWEEIAFPTEYVSAKLTSAIASGKQWLNRIKQQVPNTRFGAVLFASNPKNENPHLHVLMISDPRYKRKLIDVPTHYLELICKENCRITTQKEWSNDTITNYLAKEKNLHLNNPDQGAFDVFRINLLNELKI